MAVAQSKTSVFEQNKFYATTTLSGFSFIHGSKSKLELSFWYLVTLFFLSLTVISIYRLVEQYLSFKTLTHVTLHQTPNEIQHGVFQLRVHIALPEFYPEFQNSSVKFNFPNSYNGAKLMDELEEILAEMNTADQMMHSDWDYALLPPLARYFLQLTACETQPELCSVLYNPFSVFFEIKRLAGIKQATNYIFDHSRKLGISDRQMVDKFGRELLRWAGVNVVTISPVSVIDILPLWEHWNIRLSGVSGTSFGSDACLDFFYLVIPDRPVARNSQVSEIDFQIHFDYEKLVSLLLERHLIGENSSHDEARRWYETFNPAIMLYMDGEIITVIPSVTTETGMWSFWNMKLVAQINSIKECLENNTMVASYMACMSDTQEKVCNCTPPLLSALKSQTQSPYCTADQEFKCVQQDNSNIILNKYNTCVSSVPIDCNKNTYEFAATEKLSMESVEALIGVKLSGAAIALFLTPGIYTLYQEEYAQSFSSFLGELGGTFDFWIGASVIGLIHLVLYLGKQCFYKTKRNKNVKQAPRDSDLCQIQRKIKKLTVNQMALYKDTKKQMQRLDSKIAKLRRQIRHNE